MTQVTYERGKGIGKRAILALLLVETVMLLIVFAAGVAGGAQYYYHKGGGYIQGVSQGVSACWDEENNQMPDRVERICGDIDKAPAGSKIISIQVGDDNMDGIVMEDESGWDCKTMGNKICGPAS